jgi:microcystin-dependent protein
MSEPFIGEMRVVAFDFAPRGWLPCDGRSLQVRQNQALFQLLGTTYGGDGVALFNLPDLRGRVPVGAGASGTLYALGFKGGQETHLLTNNEVPGHTHALMASPSTNAVAPPNGHMLASSESVYVPTLDKDKKPLPPPPPPLVNLHPQSIGMTGGTPHENRQPFTVMNVIIAINGIFPSRS